MDLTPIVPDNSDTESIKGEIEAPAALPLPLGLTPDQLKQARRNRRKYGLAQPHPNSPKPKLKNAHKSASECAC